MTTADPNRPIAVVPRLGHRRWLDGLRGLAILLVMGFHLHVLPGGFLGVDVFFVLSGFLITSLLIEEWQQHGTIRLPRFYLRRGLRLLPAFALLLLVCSLCVFLTHPADEALRWREIGVAACYLTNWPTLHQTPLPTLGHTWSLSIEEQFYLIWPLLLFGLLRSNWPRWCILLLASGGVLTSAVLRAWLYCGHHASEVEKATTKLQLYIGLHSRADALLIGCLAGLLVMGNLLPTSRRFVRASGRAALAATAALAYLATCSCMDHCQLYLGLFTVVALLVAVILVRLWLAPLPLVSPLLETPILVGAGRISYGLYLFHVPIFHWLQPQGASLWLSPGPALLATGLTLAAALLSYFCVERPCLRWKDRVAGEGNRVGVLRRAASRVLRRPGARV